jgi:hypothetical protein
MTSSDASGGTTSSPYRSSPVVTARVTASIARV